MLFREAINANINLSLALAINQRTQQMKTS